jgi:hypothetical protein
LPETSAREVKAVTLLAKLQSYVSSHFIPSILPAPGILPSRLSSSASHEIMAHSFQHNMSKDGAAPIQGGNSPFTPRDMGNESPPPSSSFEVPSPNMANQYPLQDSSFDVSAHSSTFHFTFPLQSTPNEFPPQNMYYAGPPQDVASAYQPRPPETPQPKAKRTEDPSPQDISDSVVIIPGILMVGHAILTRAYLPKPLASLYSETNINQRVFSTTHLSTLSDTTA